MHFTKSILSLSIVLAVSVGACGEDGLSPGPGPNSLDFLEHANYGCVANRGGIDSCLEGARLTGLESVGDTIVLWIRFEANCCPEFSEDVSYDDGVLDISVVDTLHACRCICPFENAFRFLHNGTGELRVLFESRATRGADICLSGLDTTIAIPSRPEDQRGATR